MEFRSITDLEQLEALPDDAQILVIDNNTAKRISKTNAHFGGGGAGAMVVNFTLDSTGLSADKTVEEVTTAMASMPVIGSIIMANGETGETPVTVHLGACFPELNGGTGLAPAFGPFIYKTGKILGAIGVNSSGQWEARMGS